MGEARISKEQREGRRGMAFERFREFLREHGLKFTHEREAIVGEFLDTDDHVDADDFLVRLRRAGSSVSRATIYRTLDLLVQAGLARRIRLGADHYYYERVLGRRQHEHMVCLGCDRIIEWYDPELQRLLAENVRRRDFVPTRHSIQVFGFCEDCADDPDAREQIQQARSRYSSS